MKYQVLALNKSDLPIGCYFNCVKISKLLFSQCRHLMQCMQHQNILKINENVFCTYDKKQTNPCLMKYFKR